MADINIVQKTFRIDDRLTTEGRERVGRLIIEEIKKRTARGVDKSGSPFPKYSKLYKKSLDFKNAGKSSKVNLTLSGDMLGSLEIIEHAPGLIKIGFDAGSFAGDKAEGSIIGSYGQSSGSSSKARDFLGLPDDVIEILSKQALGDDIVEQTDRAQSRLSGFLDSFLRRNNG